MGELAKRFGQEVKRRRQARGLTQPELADAAGLSEEWVRRIERGAATPSFDSLEALGTALEAPVAELFAFPSPEPPTPLARLMAALEGLSAADIAWVEDCVRAILRRPANRRR